MLPALLIIRVPMTLVLISLFSLLLFLCKYLLFLPSHILNLIDIAALTAHMHKMEAEFSMVRSDMKLVMPICLRMTGDPYDVWETPFETRNGSGQSKSQNNKDATSSNTSDRAANSSNTSGKGANS